MLAGSEHQEISELDYIEGSGKQKYATPNVGSQNREKAGRGASQSGGKKPRRGRLRSEDVTPPLSPAEGSSAPRGKRDSGKAGRQLFPDPADGDDVQDKEGASETCALQTTPEGEKPAERGRKKRSLSGQESEEVLSGKKPATKRRRLYSMPIGVIEPDTTISSQRSDHPSMAVRETPRQADDASRVGSVYDILLEHTKKKPGRATPGGRKSNKPARARKSAPARVSQGAGLRSEDGDFEPAKRAPRRRAAAAASLRLRETSSQDSGIAVSHGPTSKNDEQEEKDDEEEKQDRQVEEQRKNDGWDVVDDRTKKQVDLKRRDGELQRGASDEAAEPELSQEPDDAVDKMLNESLQRGDTEIYYLPAVLPPEESSSDEEVRMASLQATAPSRTYSKPKSEPMKASSAKRSETKVSKEKEKEAEVDIDPYDFDLSQELTRTRTSQKQASVLVQNRRTSHLSKAPSTNRDKPGTSKALSNADGEMTDKDPYDFDPSQDESDAPIVPRKRSAVSDSERSSQGESQPPQPRRSRSSGQSSTDAPYDATDPSWLAERSRAVPKARRLSQPTCYSRAAAQTRPGADRSVRPPRSSSHEPAAGHAARGRARKRQKMDSRTKSPAQSESSRGEMDADGQADDQNSPGTASSQETVGGSRQAGATSGRRRGLRVVQSDSESEPECGVGSSSAEELVVERDPLAYRYKFRPLELGPNISQPADLAARDSPPDPRSGVSGGAEAARRGPGEPARRRDGPVRQQELVGLRAGPITQWEPGNNRSGSAPGRRSSGAVPLQPEAPRRSPSPERPEDGEAGMPLQWKDVDDRPKELDEQVGDPAAVSADPVQRDEHSVFSNDVSSSQQPPSPPPETGTVTSTQRPSGAVSQLPTTVAPSNATQQSPVNRTSTSSATTSQQPTAASRQPTTGNSQPTTGNHPSSGGVSIAASTLRGGRRASSDRRYSSDVSSAWYALDSHPSLLRTQSSSAGPPPVPTFGPSLASGSFQSAPDSPQVPIDEGLALDVQPGYVRPQARASLRSRRSGPGRDAAQSYISPRLSGSGSVSGSDWGRQPVTSSQPGFGSAGAESRHATYSVQNPSAQPGGISANGQSPGSTGTRYNTSMSLTPVETGGGSESAHAASAAAAAGGAIRSRVGRLVDRWRRLADLERRIVAAMEATMERQSALVATHVHGLTAMFEWRQTVTDAISAACDRLRRLA